ncbi:hypothetical protein Poli38472_004813 [Pythium oligandrum]|uniref:PDZ domain-containing protein n=1 Tax=Pythium oligandrum TaxID=41045 RepID=A0A8K1FG85_PYTOL|nr:hypothetical protein Poli38472_004813 [Pythium oligandrum]|eukprot:TMW59744.1 hypothetical protein Poli38472_004813 [Pythium oligandrum]
MAFPMTAAPAISTSTSDAILDAAVAAVGASAGFGFDEHLIAMPSDLASTDATPFFIDTAAIAQQIAAAVSDEKKLSDNILDLIPPPQSTATEANTSAETPLEPPPGLMGLRALSPPISLLPELSQPLAMPPLSLDTAVSGATTVAATATTTVPTVPAPAALPGADDRRKSPAYSAASMLKKRKSGEAFTENGTSAPIASSSYITSSTSTATPSTATPASTTPTPVASSVSSVSAASNLQALAREKVMKEPQSGDLYECVITKRNGGLGLTLACVDDHVQITGLAPDTPAANSGICVGDTLVAVSGLPVRGLQFSTVIGRLKSSSRNSVVLKLRRNPFRHNGNGNGLPYRSGTAASAGIAAGLKRPARPLTKTAESNSANVLSHSKTMALETRLAGSNGSAVPSSVASAGFQVKTEPTHHAYFPTDASILTMPSASAAASSVSTTPPVAPWRVAEEERDRYYAETRRLRQELAQVMAWRRRDRSARDVLEQQFQQIATKFEREMQTIFQIGSSSPNTTANGTTSPSSTASTNSEKAHHEDLVALRQKLLEVNHALARQQTEILELKERDARHASHEARRIKTEIVREIQTRMHELVMSVNPADPTTTPSRIQTFELRVDGVRESVFELLFTSSNSSSSSKRMRTSTQDSSTTKDKSVTLDLDLAATTQLLSWNLRESQRALVVQLTQSLHVEYLTQDEALRLRGTLHVTEEKP